MGEGMTRKAGRSRRATLSGVVVALVMSGFGAVNAGEALAMNPDDAEYKATRGMVAVTGCGGGQIQMEIRERDELNLHNARRREVGAPQLCVEPSLQRAAEAHAQDMIKRGYFSHTSLEGKTPMDRAKVAGYNGYGVGENLASTDSRRTAGELFSLWMNSAGHKANLEDRDYIHVGVASADAAPVDDDPSDDIPASIRNSKHAVVFGSGYLQNQPNPEDEIPVENEPPAAAPAPAMPTVTNLKPAQGSATRDRTPLASAIVQAQGRQVSAAQIKVYVDGRLVRESYNANTDQMRAQLPSLRPGKHTVKVTVSGGPSLKVVTARFTVK